MGVKEKRLSNSVTDKKPLFRESYPFVNDNIFLCAEVYSNGKQKLVMELRDKKTDKVVLKDSIDCIHTVVTTINFDEYKEFKSEFRERMLNVANAKKKDAQKGGINEHSTAEFELNLDEKFKAFKSWVAGIAESGLDAFRIQNDIESAGFSSVPISHRIIRFLIHSDKQLVLDYIASIERKSYFEGKKHRAYLIANLDPIIKSLGLNSTELSARDFTILSAILQIQPPIDIFLLDSHNMRALEMGVVATHPQFIELFYSPDPEIRKHVATNHRSIYMPHYKIFLSHKTEPDIETRCRAASNILAPINSSFKNFLSISTEPDEQVRMRAALNENSASFIEFQNFLSYKTEPCESVRIFAAMNKNSRKYPLFRTMFHKDTEPSGIVRNYIASNPNSVKFKEYNNFFDKNTEPDELVRIEAARNPLSPDLEGFNNFFDHKIETSDKVRMWAANNKNAPKLENFKLLLDPDSEPNNAIRDVAASNYRNYQRMLKQKEEHSLKSLLARKERAKRENNNIICPKCGHINYKSILKEKKCIFCGIRLPI